VKVRVLVMPKTGVLDPQGRAVQRALRDLGYQAAVDARTGRVIELELATTDAAEAHALAAEMCDKLLANPVIEDYSVELP
jgi:phosphoribosylformylglycinamidine synthase